MKNKILIVFILFISLIIYSTVKEILEGEKGRVKRTVYSAKKAIEKKDILKFISYVSFDYADEYGNDRRQVMLIARTLIEEYESISVKIKELEIEVEGSRAGAEIEAVIFWVRESDAEQRVVEYDQAKFKVNFNKEDGKWKAVGVEDFEPIDLYLPGIS